MDLPYDLKPALTLESALVLSHQFQLEPAWAMERTHQADSEQGHATVSIGWADGWTRDMQNFAVLVDAGKRPNCWTSFYGPNHHSSAQAFIP